MKLAHESGDLALLSEIAREAEAGASKLPACSFLVLRILILLEDVGNFEFVFLFAGVWMDGPLCECCVRAGAGHLTCLTCCDVIDIG